MNETYQSTLEIDDRTTLPESFVTDLEGFSKEQLLAFAEEVDSILSPLLSANADKLIYCERLGGVEMTLGQAVNTIWPVSDKGAMVREGLSSVMAEIQRMLNTPVGKTEEIEEEKSQNQAEQLITEVADVGEQSKNEAIQTEYTESSATTSEADSGDQVQLAAAFEITADVLGSISDTTVWDDAIPSEVTIAPIKVAQRSAPEKLFAQTSQESPPLKKELKEIKPSIKPAIESEDQLPISLVSEVKIAKASTYKPVPIANTTKSMVGQELEPKVEENQPLELHISVTPDKAIELDEEEIGVPTTDLADLTPEPITEIMINEVEEIGLNSIEPVAFSIPMWEELRATIGQGREPDEVSNPEQPFQVSIEFEGIEDVLLQLVESIENSEPETAEALNEILDKIIEVPAMLEGDGENSLSELEAQEQLEELFIELFELAGIDYTPEVIESLANLIINSHLAEEIDNPEYEETSLASHGIGTHEIIKKLLAVLNSIKKAIAHAATIGRSALRFCNLGFDFGQSRYSMHNAST